MAKTKQAVVNAEAVIAEIKNLLDEALKDERFIENIYRAMEEGTEQFSEEAPRNAARSLLIKLATAQTKLASLIADTKRQYKV